MKKNSFLMTRLIYADQVSRSELNIGILQKWDNSENMEKKSMAGGRKQLSA